MRTLLLLALAFVSVPVSAEELQVTIIGVACTLFSPPECLGPGTYTTPFTITYDVDTTSGQQTSSVGPGPFSIEGGVLISYVASNLAVTNYSVILGGQTYAFAAHTTGRFAFVPEARDAYDFAGSAGTGKGGFGFDSFASPLVTASEFATLQDPLASLLLAYGSNPCSHGECALGNPGQLFAFTPISGTMRIVGVPSPGPLLLFLTGLVALTLSQRRKVGTIRCATAQPKPRRWLLEDPRERPKATVLRPRTSTATASPRP